jgi:ferritin
MRVCLFVSSIGLLLLFTRIIKVIFNETKKTMSSDCYLQHDQWMKKKKRLFKSCFPQKYNFLKYQEKEEQKKKFKINNHLKNIYKSNYFV